MKARTGRGHHAELPAADKGGGSNGVWLDRECRAVGIDTDTDYSSNHFWTGEIT